MTLSPNKLFRRLLPLYLAAFMLGIPFWYAIEKLFMMSIGFDTALIGVMVVCMSIVMLAVEIPSGIMADRWSRKGVIIIGSIALALSAIAGGFSYAIPMYIFSTILWGVYSAMYSGTYEAIIYDTILESESSSNKYERYLGYFKIFEGISFVIGALIGGVIASYLGLRETYFISIPFILGAILFVLAFKEPRLHRAEATEPVLKHVKQTFSAILRNPVLPLIVVSIVGFAIVQESFYELSQLWFIALATPLILYGPFSAILFSTWTIGGLISSRIVSKKGQIISVAILMTSVTAMIFVQQYWVTIACQFIALSSLVMLGVALSKKLQDELPSRLRAGASSFVSTITRIIIIPATILFTWVAQENGIFNATYIILAIGLVASVAFIIHLSKQAARPE